LSDHNALVGKSGVGDQSQNGRLLVSTSRLGEPSALLLRRARLSLTNVARHLEDDAEVCEPWDSCSAGLATYFVICTAL
jgi:hypothetical protein